MKHLNCFGYVCDPSTLMLAEQALLSEITRWRSTRGTFGTVWIAQRNGVVYLKGRFKERHLPPLLILLKQLTVTVTADL